MSPAPTRPDDGFDPAERIERQSRALQALAEAGIELARALVDETACGREGAFRGLDPAFAYSRISRAVRLAIALELRLWEAQAAAAAPAVRADAEADGDETTAAVETGTAEGCERPETERPESERPDSERLREDLSDAALLSRPRAEVYALICRDLGASPEPGLFEPCNDDAAAPEAPAAPARRLAGGAGRSALLNSAAAGPMAGPEPAPGPFPRPPP